MKRFRKPKRRSMPDSRHTRDPFDRFLHQRLKTATPLRLYGNVEDPHTKQWIEARSESEFIGANEYVYVSKIDYNRRCLVVRRFHPKNSDHSKNQEGKVY